MVKIGLVNLDTSHVIAFTQRLHKKNIDEAQWVDGGQVVAAWRGESNVRTPEQIEEYAVQLRDDYGVELVDDLDDMLGKVDAVCIEANEGWRHLPLVEPFLKAGMTCWIDKPFAGSFDEARRIIELADENGGKVFSASSLRFSDEVVDFSKEFDTITGVDAMSPSPLHWANPGLLHYGIHGVEILFALMGEGCQSVSCLSLPDQELCVGRWADGRIGSMRGTHGAPRSYEFRATVGGEKPAVHTRTVGTTNIYRNMLREMIGFFETGERPISNQQLLEVMGFMDAAALSAKLGGQPVPMPW